MISTGLIFSAFIAGLLTFLAPCTLPLVPGYLAFISGISIEELEKKDSKNLRKKFFLSGLLFVVGFSVVFISFGILAGSLGSALIQYRIWMTRIGGILVIFFGLFMMGLFKLPVLSKERRLSLSSRMEKGRYINSFLLGLAFAVGWTPCVGPVLGSILILASSSSTAFSGGVLLLVFSIGLAVPFLIVSVAAGWAVSYIQKIQKYLNVVSIVGGIFLIIVGILLLTNNFGLLISWGFRALEFLGYEEFILDYV